MELLDRANTETFVTPVPTQVTLNMEKGLFIVITSHDLKLLLKQTEGKGVSIYYTELVKQTPKDTVVLTLACGEYRFNDMGTIGGLPRLMDMGQCNDAYSAIQVALALADAFQCGVNDLPLSLVLSWYEQKAVCILLTLLALGIQNIRLGPTLPAFVSPNILNYLIEHFHITPTTTPGFLYGDVRQYPLSDVAGLQRCLVTQGGHKAILGIHSSERP